MAYIDLDKVINITGGGSAGTYPDGSPYPVLAQSIGLFNKEDARDAGNSEGWMGLLYSSNNTINAQNNNWNTQYIPAIMQGTGALSAKVKSYAFSADIDTVDGGEVVAGLYVKPNTNPQDFLRFGSVTAGQIDNVDNVSDAIPIGRNKKGYIATSGGNDFLLFGSGENINIVSVDGNGKPNGSVSQHTINNNLAGSNVYVAGALGDRVRICNLVCEEGVSNINDIYLYIQLYSIDSVGALTFINESLVYHNHARNIGTANAYVFIFGSYIYNDKAVIYARVGIDESGTGSGYQGLNIYSAGTIDLASTASVSYTEYAGASFLTDFSTFIGEISIGYDSTNDLIIFRGVHGNSTSLYSLSSGGVVTALSQHYAGDAWNYLSHNSGSVAILTDENSMIIINSSTLKVLGTDVAGTITSLFKKIMLSYKVDGTNTSDDGFKGLMITNDATGTCLTDSDNLAVSIAINANTAETKDVKNYINFSSIKLEFTDFSTVPALASTDVEIELAVANPNARDIKMGFNLTGGSYTTPTGGNDLSGDATTQRSPGANATYLNLTLTA